MINRYKITLPYSEFGSTGSTSLTLSAQTQPSKYVTIPINLSFNSTLGLGESIDNLVSEEEQKSINPTYDGEKVRYKSYDINGYDLNFRFYNDNSGTFVDDYSAAGFSLPNDLRKNGFRKSYFRLYFYDVNEPQNRNLLFYEDINITKSTDPNFSLKKIYWLRNDKLFNTTLQNRSVYMVARFFNAKTGKIHDFINLPQNMTTPITITQFSNNPDWWSSPIEMLNPRNNNGGYNFTTAPSVGSNTSNSITLTEQIIV